MFIKVKPLKGTEHTIELPDDSTLDQLQKSVLQKCGVPKESQKLVYKGTILSESCRTLKDYSITDNAKITLFVKEPPRTANQKLQSLLKRHLQTRFDERDIEPILNNFMKILNGRIASMSLNDIEKLAEVWKPCV